MSHYPPGHYQSLHATTSKVSDADKRKRLTTWKHWHRYGLRGAALERRAKMNLKLVRKWAADLDFDLEGLA